MIKSDGSNTLTPIVYSKQFNQTGNSILYFPLSIITNPERIITVLLYTLQKWRLMLRLRLSAWLLVLCQCRECAFFSGGHLRNFHNSSYVPNFHSETPPTPAHNHKRTATWLKRLCVFKLCKMGGSWSICYIITGFSVSKNSGD